jgi:hypothetical protein
MFVRVYFISNIIYAISVVLLVLLQLALMYFRSFAFKSVVDRIMQCVVLLYLLNQRM